MIGVENGPSPETTHVREYLREFKEDNRLKDPDPGILNLSENAPDLVTVTDQGNDLVPEMMMIGDNRLVISLDAFGHHLRTRLLKET